LSSSYTTESVDKLIWTISVEDSGIGLTEEEQSRLFKPFSQATEGTFSQYGGSGLGLKICKDLVELMNGSISVKSVKEEGSSFIFHVQFFKSTEQEELANSKSLLEKSGRKTTGKTNGDATKPEVKKILIAEDNPINAKLLNKLLQNVGHECQIVVNGVEAVKSVATEHFDIVLMDIEMPVLSGLEATRIIRKSEEENGLPAIPIVGISANARASFYETALNNGFNEYITKPYLKEDVYEAIRKWAL
jgi:CheY-like chemotaxis protein